MYIFIKKEGARDYTCFLNTKELLEQYRDNAIGLVIAMEGALTCVTEGMQVGAIEDAYISGLGCQHVRHLESGTNISADNFMLSLNPHPDSHEGQRS